MGHNWYRKCFVSLKVLIILVASYNLLFVLCLQNSWLYCNIILGQCNVIGSHHLILTTCNCSNLIVCTCKCKAVPR